MNLPEFSKMEAVSVKRGDVIVLCTDKIVTAEFAAMARAQLKELFPHNNCLILDQGMTLEVYREQKESEKKG